MRLFQCYRADRPPLPILLCAMTNIHSAMPGEAFVISLAVWVASSLFCCSDDDLEAPTCPQAADTTAGTPLAVGSLADVGENQRGWSSTERGTCTSPSLASPGRRPRSRRSTSASLASPGDKCQGTEDNAHGKARPISRQFPAGAHVSDCSGAVGHGFSGLLRRGRGLPFLAPGR